MNDLARWLKETAELRKTLCNKERKNIRSKAKEAERIDQIAKDRGWRK